jgi:hypothetical protein
VFDLPQKVMNDFEKKTSISGLFLAFSRFWADLGAWAQNECF